MLELNTCGIFWFLYFKSLLFFPLKNNCFRAYISMSTVLTDLRTKILIPIYNFHTFFFKCIHFPSKLKFHKIVSFSCFIFVDQNYFHWMTSLPKFYWINICNDDQPNCSSCCPIVHCILFLDRNRSNNMPWNFWWIFLQLIKLAHLKF